MTESVENVEGEWNMSPSEWIDHWAKGASKSFHLPYVSGIIKKHYEKLVAGRENIKVLFPFCGKDVDMKWIADQGHTVVGCECAPQGVKEFFEEQKLPYSTKKVDDFEVYSSEDGKLVLYCGDFMKFSSKYEGQFDAIWDRGALNSVNTREMLAYAQIMISLMKPDTQYLIMTYDTEDEKTKEEWGIYMVTDDKLVSFFGEKCDLQLRVEYVPASTYNGDLMGPEEEHHMEKLTIVTLKK